LVEQRITAMLLIVCGLILVLNSLLRRSGDAILASLALTLYVIGTAVLVAEGSFLSYQEWVLSQVVLYVLLAFLAQAAFGVVLLVSR
jgi:hypothetical protein